MQLKFIVQILLKQLQIQAVLNVFTLKNQIRKNNYLSFINPYPVQIGNIQERHLWKKIQNLLFSPWWRHTWQIFYDVICIHFCTGPDESGRSLRKQTILRDESRRSFEPKRTIFWLKADDLMKADDPILAEKWIDLCNDSVIEVLDSKSEVSFGYDKG